MNGETKLLKIYVGEQEHYHDKPIYQYLVRFLKEKGIGGVTVSRGIEGHGQDKVLHTARLLELSADRQSFWKLLMKPIKLTLF